MDLQLVRNTFTNVSTIGTLYVDGVRECYTLEDTVRSAGVKVFGKTAIPPGTYKIVVTMSNRFKVRLPLLVSVPNFEGVRIHTGNTDKNTEGCILVGTNCGPNLLKESRKAFTPLMQKIEDAIARGERVTLTIK